ncbi:MAG TPA: energy transducer TonB [Pyrinomonadaceae bacterium]|nr:energy transducer TonB [Pyrinomonadaceae bacterium]
MSANYSTATRTRTYEYRPTVIEDKLLVSRLAIQLALVKNDPLGFLKQSARELLSTRHAILALAVVAAIAMFASLPSTTTPTSAQDNATADAGPIEDMVLLDLKSEPGSVGFRQGTGGGSGPTPKSPQGGGGGGEGSRTPQQTGKLPPPATIQAAIPIAPPIHPPALPVAGIDLDPALWRDLKAPVYGDPRSNSEIPSKGPGESEGIGSNRGLGIGSGDGPGVGPGNDGNMGGGSKQLGCCGPGGGDPDKRTFTGLEVDQRARLLSKPEPQYTEEARRNQISGTVMLRVVFSSSGEVVQIRALNTLPFGLTERAIAAARQIKFVPAMKGGRAVSVHMQLEYNFNLY